MKKDHIQYEDFAKLDLRVGEVVGAKKIEGSRKLLELSVDLGPEYGTVTILAGMAEHYEPDFFLDKHYIFVANLAPKEMAGSVSNGMMLAADEEGRPVPLEVSETLPPGTLVR